MTTATYTMAPLGIALLLTVMGCVQAGPTAGLQVGGAYADITPDRVLPNYNGSPLGVGDGSSFLQAHVIICSDGRTQAAIISVDATFIGRDQVLRIRDELNQRIGIDPKNVCIGATHAHHSPALAASFLAGALPDPQYVDRVVGAVGDAAEKAVARMEPAVLITAELPAPPIGVNRRRLSPRDQAYHIGAARDPKWPGENPIDTKMQFVAFETLTGDPIGVIFNFPCHNNVYGGNVYSGDMFARAGQEIRRKLGDQVATVSLAAPSGDVGWFHPTGSMTVADDRAGGLAIAKPILEAYEKGRRCPGRELAVESIIERIPDRTYDESTFCRDNCRGDSSRPVFRNRYDPEEKAVQARGQSHCLVEIQCIGFGPVAIVTNPAELFSIYGVRIREASPFEVTIVSSLSNGYCGYVPTPDAFEHKGYETHRTIYTSRLVKDGGDRIERHSVQQLRRVWEEMN